jgi:hypothetical protein
MHHQTLREVAKIASGIVFADIIGTLWFSQAGLLPMTMLGVRWTNAMVPEILVFDLALLMLCVHYGWNMKLPISSPSERTLLWVAGVIFLVVAVGHLMQLMFNVHLILGDFKVPQWMSWLGILLTAYLSYSSFHFAKHMHGRR